jgi:hypothetical protein
MFRMVENVLTEYLDLRAGLAGGERKSLAENINNFKAF